MPEGPGPDGLGWGTASSLIEFTRKKIAAGRLEAWMLLLLLASAAAAGGAAAAAGPEPGTRGQG